MVILMVSRDGSIPITSGKRGREIVILAIGRDSCVAVTGGERGRQVHRLSLTIFLSPLIPVVNVFKSPLSEHRQGTSNYVVAPDCSMMIEKDSWNNTCNRAAGNKIMPSVTFDVMSWYYEKCGIESPCRNGDVILASVERD